MNEYVPRHCRKLTRKTYESTFRNHIKPKWGDVYHQKVKTVAVEDWLESYPRSRQIKSHIRSPLHTVFNAAIRWEIDHNPITLIRQPKKRL